MGLVHQLMKGSVITMINKNRRAVVWALLPVLIALLYLGGVGPVEFAIWLVLLAGWLWLLLVWSRRPAEPAA